ncbi:MAG: Mur ligase domain-containing protein, partial [Acidimicrobiales bacterium]
MREQRSVPDPPSIPDLRSPRRIHVVGVGGSGMSAIAAVLATMGHQVSGSDLRLSETLERLRGLGVAASVGHDPEKAATADLVAVSTAIPGDDPDVAAASAQAVPVYRRSQVLAA